MLSDDTRFFGADVVEHSDYLYTLFSVLHFSLCFWVFLVVIQKVLPLKHKAVGTRFKEGPNLSNVLSTHISGKIISLAGIRKIFT